MYIGKSKVMRSSRHENEGGMNVRLNGKPLGENGSF